jgi:hypothetical protein
MLDYLGNACQAGSAVVQDCRQGRTPLERTSVQSGRHLRNVCALVVVLQLQPPTVLKDSNVGLFRNTCQAGVLAVSVVAGEGRP